VTERRFRRCGLIELADKGQNLFQRTGIRELRSLLMPTTMIVAPDLKCHLIAPIWRRLAPLSNSSAEHSTKQLALNWAVPRDEARRIAVNIAGVIAKARHQRKRGRLSGDGLSRMGSFLSSRTSHPIANFSYAKTNSHVPQTELFAVLHRNHRL
jgi:hypothetical protein